MIIHTFCLNVCAMHVHTLYFRIFRMHALNAKIKTANI